ASPLALPAAPPIWRRRWEGAAAKGVAAKASPALGRWGVGRVPGRPVPARRAAPDRGGAAPAAASDKAPAKAAGGTTITGGGSSCGAPAPAEPCTGAPGWPAPTRRPAAARWGVSQAGGGGGGDSRAGPEGWA